jgi:hypothetical protein
MKSKLSLIVIVFVFFAACNTTKKTNTKEAEKTIEPTIVGAEKDEHGCKGSAGYQWSELKNECIRIFESGIRLNPVSKDVDQTTSAFIVFKSKEIDIQVELFLPSEKKSIILDKNGKSVIYQWKNENYILTEMVNNYKLLDKNGELLYEGNVEGK